MGSGLATLVVASSAVEKLRLAIEELAREEPSFTGTTYATARLMDGVSHQQIRNLLDGKTAPWHLRVETMHEICRVFRGITPRDFARPGDHDGGSEG